LIDAADENQLTKWHRQVMERELQVVERQFQVVGRQTGCETSFRSVSHSFCTTLVLSCNSVFNKTQCSVFIPMRFTWTTTLLDKMF